MGTVVVVPGSTEMEVCKANGDNYSIESGIDLPPGLDAGALFVLKSRGHARIFFSIPPEARNPDFS